jgi:hypothetical protein
MHLDDWPVQHFGSQLKSLECLNVDYGLDEIDENSGCFQKRFPALKTKSALDFTLPLLKGLQSCANLKCLRFNFNRNFDNMGRNNEVNTCLTPLGTFMENIATNCQKISTLELDADTPFMKYEGGIHLKWITWIPKFQNLETMIVKAFMKTVCQLDDEYDEETDQEDEFSAQSKIHYDAFFQSPLVYLKNLIMTDVTLFLHEDFLSRILEAFPSLEKYVLINGGNPYVIGFIGTKNLVAVLESLCRIKRVSISNLVLVLGQSDDLDSAQTKVIFETALTIVNEKFDQRCGPLKIVDEKHGYVIRKNMEEEAIILNTQEVNGCKVIKKSYNEKEEKFVLTVEGTKENLVLNLPKEVVKSLVDLLPEDQDINDPDRMMDEDDW